MQETYLSYYWDSVWEEDRVYPGVRLLLEELKEQGYRTGLLSDKRSAYGGPELEHADLGHLLDHVSFMEDGKAYKPDPQRLFAVMNDLALAPGECLYVGDSRVDIECAHRAGAASGAALWASVDRERVLALAPAYRWEDLDGIRSTLRFRPG